MHLPDKRLLVEGQATAAADSGGDTSHGSSRNKKPFRWIRQKAMRTGADYGSELSIVS
jgi:hypothetical protein